MSSVTYKLFIMKPALLALILCLPAFAVAQAQAQPQSAGGGSELRNSGLEYARICGPSVQGQSSPYAGACGIWLAGVVDGLQAYNTNRRTLPLFNAGNLTVGQVSKLLLKFIADHPDKAQLPAAALVLGTLIENFPPQESAPPKQ